MMDPVDEPTLEVCERHRSESPSACEGQVYEATGAEAEAVGSNARCKGCGRPLARILDRVGEVREKDACDFCYRLGRRVAVAREGMMGVCMKICESCVSDAAIALGRSRDRAPAPKQLPARKRAR